MKNLWIIVLSALFFSACSEMKNEETKPVKTEEKIEYPIIEETMMSVWDLKDNVDSPAFYQDDNNNWIIATMKESDGVIIYEAVSGDVLRKFGESGTGELQFERPNGIWVIDDMMLIVERDNQRVQVISLPDFKFLGYIAQDKLRNPYGLSVHKEDEKYELYITDQYENEDESIPADNLLDKRVLHYRFWMSDGSLQSEFVRYIGETEGEGVLHTVESIYADPENNNLLIAEETEAYTHIKIYDLEKGTYIKGIGKDLFKYQAEGIALYDCGNGKGFWFLTDQFTGDNTFHIFSRKDFEYITSFRSEHTKNTDGVWLTQNEFENHPKGSFIMVNNDGGIGAYDLNYLMNELNLKCE